MFSRTGQSFTLQWLQDYTRLLYIVSTHVISCYHVRMQVRLSNKHLVRQFSLQDLSHCHTNRCERKFMSHCGHSIIKFPVQLCSR